MAEKQKWIVTYTKHVKQKRKVYHDGYLVLHTSSRKAMLYDETNGLLESKTLKKDEVVSSGESLTFQAHLVDVSDLEGEEKPTPILNPQPSVHKPNHKPFSVLKPNFKKTSSPFEKKPKLESQPAKNLSPSHKMIRVFKKREMHKYAATQSSPLTTKPSRTDANAIAPSSADKSVVSSKEAISKPSNDEEHADSSSGIGNFSKVVSSNKSLRDAKQILSVLLKPNARQNAPNQSSDYLTETEGMISSSKGHQDSHICVKIEIDESKDVAGITKNQHSVLLKGTPSKAQDASKTVIANTSQVPVTSSDGVKNDLKTHIREYPSFDLGI